MIDPFIFIVKVKESKSWYIAEVKGSRLQNSAAQVLQ